MFHTTQRQIISFKLQRFLLGACSTVVACQFDETHISLTIFPLNLLPALNKPTQIHLMSYYWHMLHIVNTPTDAHKVNFNYRWRGVFFHFCMDVMRIWSLIRKPLIKLQSTVLSRTEGWRRELCRRQTCSSASIWFVISLTSCCTT